MLCVIFAPKGYVLTESQNSVFSNLMPDRILIFDDSAKLQEKNSYSKLLDYGQYGEATKRLGYS